MPRPVPLSGEFQVNTLNPLRAVSQRKLDRNTESRT